MESITTKKQNSLSNRLRDRILRIKAKLNSLLAEQTGKPLDVIKNDTERDNFMTAAEACEYGLIDKVIENVKTVALRRF